MKVTERVLFFMYVFRLDKIKLFSWVDRFLSGLCSGHTEIVFGMSLNISSTGEYL